MASRGALGDVVYVTVNLVVGHTLDGAIPPSGAPAGCSQARFDFIALAPVAALLVSFAYAVVRLRLRRPFLLADWPMAAAAHLRAVLLHEVPGADGPPARLRAVHGGDAADHLHRVPRGHERGALDPRPAAQDGSAGWVSTYPVGIAVLIFFVVYFWGPLHTAVDGAPAAYRPMVAARPAFARVGYAAEFDGSAFEDLRQIVNAYLGPHDRLMDITDEPALFYYFLGRDPSSRWYAPNGIVDTAELQRNLLAELRRTPPKLIVFDDTDQKMYGLQTMDGVPASVRLYLISRWILAHYRPLLESHGRTIYALPGVPAGLEPSSAPQSATGDDRGAVPRPGMHLGLRPDLPRRTGGAALRRPGGPRAHHGRARSRSVTLTGWAGDLRAGQPAREVIATVNGRIVGRSTPDIDRPDVPAAGYPAGFLRSGFQLSIPTWANASKALKVFAVGRDGSVAQLAILNAPAQGGVAKIGSRTGRPAAECRHRTRRCRELHPARCSSLSRPPDRRGGTTAGSRSTPRAGGFLQGGFELSDRPVRLTQGA